MRLDWIGQDGKEQDWMRLDWIGLDEIGQDGKELDWMRLDPIGLDGMRLDRIGWMNGMGFIGIGLDWIG